MSAYLSEIKSVDKQAARVLEKAGFWTDSEIQSLTREDLHELFPGCEKLKLRRRIFEIIQKQKPVDIVMRDLKAFIPHESLRAALSNNGVLVDYLRLLKDMKTQMDHVQGFLKAHIDVLEEFSKDPPEQNSDKGSEPCNGQTYANSAGGEGDMSTSVPMKPNTGPPAGHQGQGSRTANSFSPSSEDPREGAGDMSTSVPMKPNTGPPAGHQGQGSRTANSFSLSSEDPREVMFHMIVCGRTFDAHLQLLDKVKGQGQDRLELTEDDQDHRVTVLFCPITSRVGSDVEAAMSSIKDKKPVILVLMHHSREPKYTTSVEKWCGTTNVVLHVDVFYHETTPGLLKCQQNEVVASKIWKKLMEFSVRKSKDTRGHGRGVSAEGRNNKGSNVNDSSSGPGWLSKRLGW